MTRDQLDSIGEKNVFNTREEALIFLTTNFEMIEAELNALYIRMPEAMEEDMLEHCLPDYQVKKFPASDGDKFCIYRQVYYKQDAYKPKRRRSGLVTFYNYPANMMRAKFIKAVFNTLEGTIYWCSPISFLTEKAINGKWLMDYEHDTLIKIYELYRRRFIMRKYREASRKELINFCLENGISTKAVNL